MKTVLAFAALVAIALGATVPGHYDVETKPIDAELAAKQKRVLSFFHFTEQYLSEGEWYQVGKAYDIEKNIDNYTNKKAVEQFLYLYRTGFLPKFEVFSIFDERMQEEAVSLFYLFYYAKDFETFYKTAAFARVHFNEYMFMYSYYIAIFQRADTQGLVVPAPYEVYPEFFTNSESLYKAFAIKMENGITDEHLALHHGVVKEADRYVFYANYSNHWTYGTEEQRLAYFTEDVGLNAYYYYFHSYFPFWMKGDLHGPFKERRGEVWYVFYKQLLARYYLERLSNGLGEIPDFDWYHPIRHGYVPFMSSIHQPFIQRPDNYQIPAYKFNEELQLLDTYEKTFLQFLQRGHFKAYNQEIDFHNSKSINFVGNYWQSNPDLYEHTEHKNYYRSYETLARHLLSAVPEYSEKHVIVPSALSFYQTSLRDPVFYQMYSKIIKYFLEYKRYLEPYTHEQLNFSGVKINDVQVDKLVTFFDYFDYDITNGLYRSPEEIKNFKNRYVVRQPRLDHKPFAVTVDVKSDSDVEAVFKIYLGPKYDGNWMPIDMENNWMNFVELDWFRHKLTKGQNKIVRNSDEFFFYKDDSVPLTEIYNFLAQGKLPKSMSEEFDAIPSRLMLPRGSEGGFPYQIYVVAYPATPVDASFTKYRVQLPDNRPFSYPLDRPVIHEYYFRQPNMYFKDVMIYFEGDYPYEMTNPFYFTHHNEVSKH